MDYVEDSSPFAGQLLKGDEILAINDEAVHGDAKAAADTIKRSSGVLRLSVRASARPARARGEWALRTTNTCSASDPNTYTRPSPPDTNAVCDDVDHEPRKEEVRLALAVRELQTIGLERSVACCVLCVRHFLGLWLGDGVTIVAAAVQRASTICTACPRHRHSIPRGKCGWCSTRGRGATCGTAMRIACLWRASGLPEIVTRPPARVLFLQVPRRARARRPVASGPVPGVRCPARGSVRTDSCRPTRKLFAHEHNVTG